MRKHFRSMNDRKFSKQNFPSFQISRCNHIATQFIISLHLQKKIPYYFISLTAKRACSALSSIQCLELSSIFYRMKNHFNFLQLIASDILASVKSFRPRFALSRRHWLIIKLSIYFVWFTVIFMTASPIGDLAVLRAVKHETATGALLPRFTFAHFAICHNFMRS